MNIKQARTPAIVDSGSSPTAHAQANPARSSSSDPPSLLYPSREAGASLRLESATVLAASMSDVHAAHRAAESFFPIDGANSRDRIALVNDLTESQPSEGRTYDLGHWGTRWIPYPSGPVGSGRPDDVLPYSQLTHLAPVAFIVPALLHSACPSTLPLHILAQPLTTGNAPPGGYLLPPFPPPVGGQPDRFTSLRGHLDGPGQPNFGILKYQRRRAMSATALVRSLSDPGHLSQDAATSATPIFGSGSATGNHPGCITTPVTTFPFVADVGHPPLPDNTSTADYGYPFRRPITPPAAAVAPIHEPVPTIVEHGQGGTCPKLADDELEHVLHEATPPFTPKLQERDVESPADTNILPSRCSVRLLAKTLCAPVEPVDDGLGRANALPGGKTLRRRSGLRAMRSVPACDVPLQIAPAVMTTPTPVLNVGTPHGASKDEQDTDGEDAYAPSSEDAEGEADDEYIQPPARIKARQHRRAVAPLRKTSSDGDISVLPRGTARHHVRPQWSDPTLRHSAHIAPSTLDDGRDLLALPIQEAEYPTPSLPVGKGRKAKSNGNAMWRGSVMKAKVLGMKYLSHDGQTVLSTGFDRRLPFDIRFIAASLDERFQEFIHWKEVGIAGSTVEVIVIPDTRKFAKIVVPAMDMTAADFTSVERQLNLYGFSRSLVHRPDDTRVIMVVNEQMTLDAEEKERIKSLEWLRYLAGNESQDSKTGSRGSAWTRSTSKASSRGTSRSVSSSSAHTQLPTPSAASGTTRSPSPTGLPVTPVCAYFGGSSPRIPTSAVRDQDNFAAPGRETAWDEEDPAVLLPPKRKRLPKVPEVDAAASATPRVLNRKRSRL